jgi:hypothetical protein
MVGLERAEPSRAARLAVRSFPAADREGFPMRIPGVGRSVVCEAIAPAAMRKEALMGAKTPLTVLEEEECRARIRLAAFGARLYRSDACSAIAVQRRLRELERKWKGAAERLRHADHGRRR